MNDRGPRQPVFPPDADPATRRAAEDVKAVNPPVQSPAPNPPRNAGGLDLEDPQVRAELARRLEQQRLRRQQEEQLASELRALRQGSSHLDGSRNTEQPTDADRLAAGRLPPPSQPPHIVEPQRLPRQPQPQSLSHQARSERYEAPPQIDEQAVDEPIEQTPSAQAMTERPSTELDREAEPETKRGLGRFLLRTFLLLIVPLVAILAAIWFYVHGGRYVVTENAYLKSNIIAVSADLSGRVTNVSVSDNENVEAGRLLFTIDAQKYELEIAEAEADLGVIARDVESLRGAYREALMENRQAKKRIEHAEREFVRQETLRAKQIGTGQDYDRASSDLEIAQSEGRIYREKVARALADLGGASDAPAEEHPRYIRALAARAVAEDSLKRTEVRAPAAGVVTNMRLQPGEWVDNGTPVFSIIDSKNLWIEANLKETQLTNIKEGQAVSFVVDAYPDHDFVARVDRIAPATGSEFALLPPQNATGNWVKVVQRIPLTLEIVADDSAPVLRAGMTAKVKIDSEKERDLPVWLRKLDQQWKIPQSIRGFLGLDRYQ